MNLKIIDNSENPLESRIRRVAQEIENKIEALQDNLEAFQYIPKVLGKLDECIREFIPSAGDPEITEDGYVYNVSADEDTLTKLELEMIRLIPNELEDVFYIDVDDDRIKISIELDFYNEEE